MRAPPIALAASVTLLAATLAACGSSRQADAVPSEGSVAADTWFQTDLGTSTLNLRTVEDIRVRRDTLPGMQGDPLPHVVAAYRAKGLPVTTVNPEARLVGSVETRVRRRIDGERISRYLSCGSTVRGDRADQYEVYLTAVTQVEPLASGTGVYTHVRAYATHGSLSGSRITCSTRGRLERELLDRLRTEIAGAS